MAAPVRLKALVVGSGWAQHAARALAERADVEVAGVVARGSPRSVELARSLDAPLFGTVGKAIGAVRPDIAIVAVDDVHNILLASELARSRVHVLCAHPVAPDGDGVDALAALARDNGVSVSTDYSLRTCPAFLAARAELPALGELLRAEITFPGRLLPMALDLAVAFGGRAAKVSAFGRYPDAVRSRRAANRAAFPPSIVLEHEGGCVTTMMPCPHAKPHSAFRITTSGTRGRLDVELPAGGCRRLRCGAAGAWEEAVLARDEPVETAAELFGSAMRTLTHAFVDAVCRGGPIPCTLEDEAHVRRIWGAIARALRAHSSVAVEEHAS
jgi:predicted dehydrogenase